MTPKTSPWAIPFRSALSEMSAIPGVKNAVPEQQLGLVVGETLRKIRHRSPTLAVMSHERRGDIDRTHVGEPLVARSDQQGCYAFRADIGLLRKSLRLIQRFCRAQHRAWRRPAIIRLVGRRHAVDQADNRNRVDVVEPVAHGMCDHGAGFPQVHRISKKAEYRKIG